MPRQRLHNRAQDAYRGPKTCFEWGSSTEADFAVLQKTLVAQSERRGEAPMAIKCYARRLGLCNDLQLAVDDTPQPAKT